MTVRVRIYERSSGAVLVTRVVDDVTSVCEALEMVLECARRKLAGCMGLAVSAAVVDERSGVEVGPGMCPGRSLVGDDATGTASGVAVMDGRLPGSSLKTVMSDA